MFFKTKSLEMIAPEAALPGRADPVSITGCHAVLGHSLRPPFPEGLSQALFGMGCFWGAERLFWSIPGVWTTAVGYAGGYTPNPRYEEVCTGQTGHAEVVLVVYDPARLSLSALLTAFWESHDPTAGMRQGNDRGTQYRSALWLDSAEAVQEAVMSSKAYQLALAAAAHNHPITTEIGSLPIFYYAEEDHQQYLFKHPAGYCGLQGLGVNLPCA